MEIHSGAARLIDVFVGDLGVYVVLIDALVLTDRAGTVIAQVPSPRENTAAAFDGSLLAVADRAVLTTYDLNLSVVASGNLLEGCVSGVLVSGDRFVCGPSNDWDRVFYTYDMLSGALVASSAMYTYNGIPMRRVPGTDDFVTVTVDTSPSDFHLYSVSETGEAVFVNESPYHGDFRVTDVYGFNATPPTHLVTDEGLLLKIYGTNCNAAESVFTSGCLTKDGVLGTLTGAQIFIGMDSGADGRLHALVDANPSFSFDESVCEGGCLLQRIDVAAHLVEAQQPVSLDVGRVVAVRDDPTSSAIVVGYDLPGATHFDDPYPGHRVALVGMD